MQSNIVAPPPTLRLKLDEEALEANFKALDTLSGSARAGAAIKANCYGLGTDRCLPVLKRAGAKDFFAAHWQEVPAILEYVPPSQLSVLHGVTNNEEAVFAKSAGVRPVINSLHQARLWTEAGGGLCDVMVDTGINRLGISPHEISDPAIQKLDIDILMSHLACADEDSATNARQREAFRDATKLCCHRRLSLANSAGIALGCDYHFGVTRPGLALYGGVPRPDLGPHIRQVAYPQAAILQTREISAGETVGYNATFTAPISMRVGVVSLGYADGILRNWVREGAAFRHEGRGLPMLGKVSMDMIVADLSEVPEIKEGDWVDLPYHLPNAAQQTGLSQYELLTVLGQRFG